MDPFPIIFSSLSLNWKCPCEISMMKKVHLHELLKILSIVSWNVLYHVMLHQCLSNKCEILFRHQTGIYSLTLIDWKSLKRESHDSLDLICKWMWNSQGNFERNSRFLDLSVLLAVISSFQCLIGNHIGVVVVKLWMYEIEESE